MAVKKGNLAVATLEDFYAKLPSLPKEVNNFIVVITPWFAVIFGILGVLASLAALGIIGAVSPLIAVGSGIGTATSSMILAVIAVVSSILMIVAVPSLFSRKEMGWTLLFWSEALGVISSLISLTIGGLVGAFIGFYILFQIKSYYK